MALNDSPPKLKAPAGTCDTHMHIYDGRYPSAPTATFTPPDASVSDYLKVRARLGITAHRRGAALDLRHRQPLHAGGDRGAGRQRPRESPWSTRRWPMRRSTA
jgi:hypothetical protein